MKDIIRVPNPDNDGYSIALTDEEELTNQIFAITKKNISKIAKLVGLEPEVLKANLDANVKISFS
ncbi:MAG: hypothetical protein UR39_C0004G0038 [Candidatus Woesebacteria bacterium GW2011_GWA1_33_30]|uniref:Uncharacterized protein n=1 Tax=Candidatus Woesebacteria bacterium GW2011_GWA2_33_28 TaxID=1618561 RepID=A0A0G0CVS5_9BACT|nr:MAG: hypothetical protein UR38_C0004G0035 [Candidatus Woesebacteria bacterium GW2011_GWA2_33_28]KKP48417.1 MAG: hypothetical protein UR39_C0004G0038 [Candidatus Woesebacteria bacterium GW2011_GWA1_33_30]KKP49524.1 MAG: hypothetical protein UR40_C0005G0038 [Microgenomates group bacterium GW2011_GWC1_33_32]KKP52489.1 MAG: hypothetical protein UR44_C0002G0038 [Candidatus Woesebacteria bacterium GW2011_GWB1_33_38]KKP58347.1 MAG: hypothetical protein UR48_C0005G0025 [Microgenomates group bacteriu